MEQSNPTQKRANESGSKTEQGGVEDCATHHTTIKESYILRDKVSM
jgi:hypothetical protein